MEDFYNWCQVDKYVWAARILLCVTVAVAFGGCAVLATLLHDSDIHAEVAPDEVLPLVLQANAVVVQAAATVSLTMGK